MLSGCSSLSSLPDISKWNTNYPDMDNMFNGCFNTLFSKFIKTEFDETQL